MAERCSVSAQAVSKWENGVSYPDIGLICTLADLYEISCDELLGRKTRAFVQETKSPFLRLLKIFIQDETTTVRINLPLEAVRLIVKEGNFKGISENRLLEAVDFAQILRLADSGSAGNLVEIRDGADIVEIWVE